MITKYPSTLHIQGLIPNNELLPVWVASTWLKKMRGLAFHKTLPAKGMLFLFNKPTHIPFWMWGMRFAIDLIWLCDSHVIGWEENLKPPQSMMHLLFPYFLKRYHPPKSIDAALEVEAGFCRKQRLKIGQKLNMDIYAR